jgi:ribosomal-protein-alanine N-acetyltransferase
MKNSNKTQMSKPPARKGRRKTQAAAGEPVLRRLRMADLDALYAIQRACFVPTDGDWSELANGVRWGGVGAEVSGRLVGYAQATEATTGVLVVFPVAVHPDFRRRGVGRRLLAAVLSRARPGWLAVTAVDERNLEAQFWLKACGFRATGVERGWASMDGDDAYSFEYRVPPEA